MDALHRGCEANGLAELKEAISAGALRLAAYDTAPPPGLQKEINRVLAPFTAPPALWLSLLHLARSNFRTVWAEARGYAAARQHEAGGKGECGRK